MKAIETMKRIMEVGEWNTDDRQQFNEALLEALEAIVVTHEAGVEGMAKSAKKAMAAVDVFKVVCEDLQSRVQQLESDAEDALFRAAYK